jgi:hypothetical protein
VPSKCSRHRHFLRCHIHREMLYSGEIQPVFQTIAVMLGIYSHVRSSSTQIEVAAARVIREATDSVP